MHTIYLQQYDLLRTQMAEETRNQQISEHAQQVVIIVLFSFLFVSLSFLCFLQYRSGFKEDGV